MSSSKLRYVIKGQDLTYLGKEALDNEELKKVMSYFIGQKEADISLLPTVVIPMILAIQDKQYRIRTLLDSGSMTNWITKGVLKKLKYTTKGHDLLEVNTMTGKVQKRFQLVEVYYLQQCSKWCNMLCT